MKLNLPILILAKLIKSKKLSRNTKRIKLLGNYTLIATFHHHFYPFPERKEKNPDASFIRNYTDVLDQFQRFEVKLVLHGHKHTPVQRAITDKKYFDNPNSIIYAFAAGSIGCKGVDNLSFHWLKVFDKNSVQLCELTKYDFNDEEEGKQENIILPPRNERALSAFELNVILQNQDPKMFQAYEELTDDFEQIIQDSDAEKIIQTIGKLYTVFPEIDKSLRKEPLKIYLILLAIHYRVILLKNTYEGPSNRFDELLKRIEKDITTRIENKSFAKNLINFLKAGNSQQFENTYSHIIKNVAIKHKKYGAYVSATLFLSDLFLNISKYGEYYFKEENLDLKINVRLNKGEFYDRLPSNSVQFRSDIDRRAIYIDFKCKNPTVHKMAVLIVKDFEMRLDKLEESLKTINLKLYYISPKVTSVNYDLEDFHFNAYLPKLLPLLTGENLYKQKEVFIRELVQNAMEATLWRQRLERNNFFNTDINIEFGEEKRDSKLVKYFRILDNGIGMSNFMIERYFTSIGRSFYTSEEFEELKKDKKINYAPISSFGIGFLSSFMVSTQVTVKTKFYTDDEGWEIGIPNRDGCFFVKKIKRQRVGTEITLYEDHRERFDFDKFENYIKETFQGIPLNINVTGKKEFQVESFKQQKEMLQSIKNNELIFYIPFSEKKSTVEISWEDLINTKNDNLERCGISFNFTSLGYSHNNNVTTCNQGLAISTPCLPFRIPHHVSPKININFPSSFIQLDVAREKVNNIKDETKLTKEILTILLNQGLNFITSPSNTLSNSYLSQIEIINYFMALTINDGIDLKKQSLQRFLKTKYTSFSKEFDRAKYALKAELKDDIIELSIVKIQKIPNRAHGKQISYFLIGGGRLSEDNINFFKKVSDTFRKHIQGVDNTNGKVRIISKELSVVTQKIRGGPGIKLGDAETITRMARMKLMNRIIGEEVRKISGMGIIEDNLHNDVTEAVKRIEKMKNPHAVLFFYSSVRFLDGRRKLHDFWPLYPFLILKSYIFSTVKVGEVSSFKCVIDFEKLDNFLKKKYKDIYS